MAINNPDLLVQLLEEGSRIYFNEKNGYRIYVPWKRRVYRIKKDLWKIAKHFYEEKKMIEERDSSYEEIFDNMENGKGIEIMDEALSQSASAALSKSSWFTKLSLELGSKLILFAPGYLLTPEEIFDLWKNPKDPEELASILATRIVNALSMQSGNLKLLEEKEKEIKKYKRYLDLYMKEKRKNKDLSMQNLVAMSVISKYNLTGEYFSYIITMQQTIQQYSSFYPDLEEIEALNDIGEHDGAIPNVKGNPVQSKDETRSIPNAHPQESARAEIDPTIYKKITDIDEKVSSLNSKVSNLENNSANVEESLRSLEERTLSIESKIQENSKRLDAIEKNQKEISFRYQSDLVPLFHEMIHDMKKEAENRERTDRKIEELNYAVNSVIIQQGKTINDLSNENSHLKEENSYLKDELFMTRLDNLKLYRFKYMYIHMKKKEELEKQWREKQKEIILKTGLEITKEARGIINALVKSKQGSNRSSQGKN
ncbi:MAG: hypothetical protein GU347_03870 [Desulfurococcales archaeon]|jgi:hypothetical protein|nr:hypothetical protein [Desulfurococcales archaeon]